MFDGGHALSEGVNVVRGGDQLHVAGVDLLEAKGGVDIVKGGQSPGRNLSSLAFQGINNVVSCCDNARPRASVVQGEAYRATS